MVQMFIHLQETTHACSHIYLSQDQSLLCQTSDHPYSLLMCWMRQTAKLDRTLLIVTVTAFSYVIRICIKSTVLVILARVSYRIGLCM